MRGYKKGNYIVNSLDKCAGVNEGNVKRHSLERLDSMIEAVSGKRLTYAGLTA